MSSKEDMPLVVFEYSMVSGNGNLEGERFLNRYKVRILLDQETEKEVHQELIGLATVSQLLVDAVLDNHLSLEIFDSTDSFTFNLLEDIYDIENDIFREPIEQTSFTSNLCFIESVSILEKYRGYNLGKQLISDIIIRFGYSSAFIALRAFPLQYDQKALSTNSDIYKSLLNLESFDMPLNEAKVKLNRYYKSLGFENPFPSDSSIFVLSTSVVNVTLSKHINGLIHGE